MKAPILFLIVWAIFLFSCNGKESRAMAHHLHIERIERGISDGQTMPYICTKKSGVTVVDAINILNQTEEISLKVFSSMFELTRCLSNSVSFPAKCFRQAATPLL